MNFNNILISIFSKKFYWRFSSRLEEMKIAFFSVKYVSWFFDMKTFTMNLLTSEYNRWRQHFFLVLTYFKYLIGEKTVKIDQFFSVDQYFSLTNNFTWLKIILTKNFYQLFNLLNKNQIMAIFKKSNLLHHNLAEWRLLRKDNLKNEIYRNWSVKTAAD